MKKDKEWLQRQAKQLKIGYECLHDDYYRACDEFIYYINQLEEPEKPVIPQYVADYIEQFRGTDEFDLFFCVSAIESRVNREKLPGPDEIDYWIIDNQETFVRAWLNGYEVEKEKKYLVKVREMYFVRFEETFPLFVIDNTPGAKEQANAFDKEHAENIANMLNGKVEETE